MTENDSTKQRLLEAGAAIFAEQGFVDARLRDICAQAEANPAAVNYHFGSKRRFYAEVLASSHQEAVARHPMPRLADDPDHPEAVLLTWVRWFLELMLVEVSGPLGRLMAREIADPTDALDPLIERSIMPIKNALGELVATILGEDIVIERLHLCFFSLLGQCLFYKHAQPVLSRLQRLSPVGGSKATLAPLAGEAPSPAELDRLAEHIVDFSLAGFRQVGRSDKC